MSSTLWELFPRTTAHSLDVLDVALGRRQIIRQDVLVDVQRGQSQGHFWLQFRGETLLRHVVAALHEQVVDGVQVGLGEGGRRRGHKGDAE